MTDGLRSFAAKHKGQNGKTWNQEGQLSFQIFLVYLIICTVWLLAVGIQKVQKSTPDDLLQQSMMSSDLNRKMIHFQHTNGLTVISIKAIHN